MVSISNVEVLGVFIAYSVYHILIYKLHIKLLFITKTMNTQMEGFLYFFKYTVVIQKMKLFG